eukprot:5359764-Prymnesium_polylepis.1
MSVLAAVELASRSLSCCICTSYWRVLLRSAFSPVLCPCMTSPHSSVEYSPLTLSSPTALRDSYME